MCWNQWPTLQLDPSWSLRLSCISFSFPQDNSFLECHCNIIVHFFPSFLFLIPFINSCGIGCTSSLSPFLFSCFSLLGFMALFDKAVEVISGEKMSCEPRLVLSSL